MFAAAFRFAKRSRLRSKNDFANVFSKPFKLHGQGFILFLRPNEIGIPRLGLAISRKVSSKAVVRNRLKRVVRESFRLNQTRLGSFDIVFLAQPVLATSSTKEMSVSLAKTWLKLEQRCGK